MATTTAYNHVPNLLIGMGSCLWEDIGPAFKKLNFKTETSQLEKDENCKDYPDLPKQKLKAKAAQFS